MHTIARTSSFGSLSSGLGALPYPFHHHPSSFGSVHQSLSEPTTPSDPFPPHIVPNIRPSLEATRMSSTSHTAPARGCLKAPTKEFATKYEPPELKSQIALSPERPVPGNTRQRPNMKLERLPSNAIARIQLAEGVEPHVALNHGRNATSAGARGKCKERVPTPYVKSDKSTWLSDGEE
jgi:hypothetical protein